jgi:hypothetical protein
LSFFNPNALGTDFAVTGYRWIIEGHPTPFLLKLWNKGRVPFWIITAEQVQSIMADGKVTIAELEALVPQPLKGFSNSFHEEQRPVGGGSPVNGTLTTASGYLEDGRKFTFKAQIRVPDGDFDRGTVKVNFKLH